MATLRIDFLCEYQSKKGQKATAIVAPTFDAIYKAACSKFKIQKKGLTLYTRDLFYGTVVLSPNDLSWLESGALIVLTDRPPEPVENRQFSEPVNRAVGDLCWVDVGKGKLSARGCPTPELLVALAEKTGLNHVVTLIHEGERDEELRDENHGCVAELRHACQRLNLKWTHVPLFKRDSVEPAALPVDAGTEVNSNLSMAMDVATQLLEGDNVLVHCSAGMHRTGVFLYLVLRLAKHSLEQALRAITLIRPATHDEMLIWFEASPDGGRRAIPADDKNTLRELSSIEHGWQRVLLAEGQSLASDEQRNALAASRSHYNVQSATEERRALAASLRHYNLYTSAEYFYGQLFVKESTL